MLRLALLACVVAAPFPRGSLEGQSLCPDGAITEVLIEGHSVFDPEELPDRSRLLWAYRLANAVHVQTQAGFVEGELLFAEGDCFDPEAIRESARILREFRFIGNAEILDLPASGGNRRVVVSTRDEWSTKLGLNVRVEDGIVFEGASIFEENLLGRGITAGVYRTDSRERRDVGMAVEVPRLAGTPFDLLLRGGETRDGEAVEQAVILPFQGEAPGIGFLQRVDHRRDLFAYVLPEDAPFSHLVLPSTSQRVELSGGRRFGSPGALYLLGGGLSFERVTVGGITQAEGIRGGDYSDRVPVGGEFAAPLAAQTESRRALRVGVLAEVRRLSFEPRFGLDALNGVQDVPVGREATVTVGRSLGDTGAGRPGDVSVRLKGVVGATTPRAVGVLHLTSEGRMEDARPGRPGRWRDMLSEGHGFLYLALSSPVPHTLVLRGAIHAGWRATAPFQLTLGGPDGVRGYAENELPGGRRAVASVESRVRVPSPFPEMFDLGFTLFGDGGAIRAGGVPFGVDSGLRGTVGAGIRIGFPAGTASVIRADLAFPLGPGGASRGAVFRISAVEPIGLRGFLNPQLERSRRSGLVGEFRGVARDRGFP